VTQRAVMAAWGDAYAAELAAYALARPHIGDWHNDHPLYVSFYAARAATNRARTAVHEVYRATAAPGELALLERLLWCPDIDCDDEHLWPPSCPRCPHDPNPFDIAAAMAAMFSGPVLP